MSRRPGRPPSPTLRWLLLPAVLVALAMPSGASRAAPLWGKKSAAASSKPGRSAKSAKPAKAARGKGKAHGKSGGSAGPAAPSGPAKVAVLGFSGDGAGPVRAQVMRALRAHGFKINSGLRPVDSAEQYREMADALGLCAYVDGDVSDEGTQRTATVRIRGGHSGTRIATTTVTAERRKLPGELGKTLWKRVGPALVKARADAAKSRGRSRGPMRIDAGTPIETTPAEPEPAETPKAAAPAEPEAAAASASEDEFAEADREPASKAAAPPARRAPTPQSDDDGNAEETADDAPPPVPTRRVARAAKRRPRPDDEERDEDDDDGADLAATAAVGGARRPLALELAAGVHLTSRHYTYVDPVGVLTPYRLVWAPAPAGRIDWFPAAHAGAGVAAHLGLTAAGEVALGASSRSRDGTVFQTTAWSWAVGAKARVPAGVATLTAAVTYGVETFRIADASDGTAKPPVPNVTYQQVRAGGEVHFALPSRLSLALGGGYRYVFPATLGEVTSDLYFPRASVYGFDAGGRLGIGLGRGIELRIEGDFRRYVFAAHSEAGDARMAGGMTDDYYGATLGLAVLLGGARGF